VHDAQGALLAELDRAGDPDRRCRGYHGHAAKGELHLFGCFMNEPGHPLADGGILLVRDGEKGIESRKIPYPADRRVSRFAHGGGRCFVGNYGKPGDYRAFLRVDPEGPGPSPADVLAVPGGRAVCQFAMAGDRLVNLTPYGMLRLRDVEGWKERAARPVVAEFDCAWNAAMRPGLALAGDRVHVSDPGRGVIHEFSANDLSPLRRLEVGGRPTRMAGVGNPTPVARENTREAHPHGGCGHALNRGEARGGGPLGVGKARASTARQPSFATRGGGNRPRSLFVWTSRCSRHSSFWARCSRRRARALLPGPAARPRVASVSEGGRRCRARARLGPARRRGERGR
jgi:hypothetical protein